MAMPAFEKGKRVLGRDDETYLNTRKQLNLIIMLVDIRHTPSADDQLMYEWIMDRSKPHLVVATKLDKLSRSQIPKRLQDIKTTLKLKEGVTVYPFSAVTKQGRVEIWERLRSAFNLNI